MACRRSWQGRLTVRASSTNRASWRSGPGQAGGQGQGKLAVRARASWRSGPGQAGGQGQGKLAVRTRQADGQGQSKLASSTIRADGISFILLMVRCAFPTPSKKFSKFSNFQYQNFQYQTFNIKLSISNSNTKPLKPKLMIAIRPWSNKNKNHAQIC
jgi:hypothetical protein